MKQGQAIALCPEQLGELSTPRISCEIVMDEMRNGKVISMQGQNFTKEFIAGAEKTLAIVKAIGIKNGIEVYTENDLHNL